MESGYDKRKACNALKRLVSVYGAYTNQPKTSSGSKIGLYDQLGDLIGIGGGTFSDKLGKLYKANSRQEFLSLEQASLLVGYFNSVPELEKPIFQELLADFQTACGLPLQQEPEADEKWDSDLEATIPVEYHVVNKTLRYLVSEDGTLDIRRQYTICPNVSRFRFMSDQFIWTGAENRDALPVPIKGIDRIAPGEQNRVIWNRFDIFFDPPLQKGQQHTFEYGWHKAGIISDSAPFISTSTDETTSEITFEIELGDAYADHIVFFEEFRAIEAMNTISYESYSFDEHGRFQLSLNPKMFRHYRVRWNW